MYEIFEQLLQKYGVTAYKVSKDTGISQTTFSNWKSGRSIPKTDTMQKIADYFGITLDYLMTGNENEEEKKTNLTPVSERDIAKKIDDIIGDINNPNGSPLYFDGIEIDSKTKEIMASFVTNVRNQFEIMCELAKKK